MKRFLQKSIQRSFNFLSQSSSSLIPRFSQRNHSVLISDFLDDFDEEEEKRDYRVFRTLSDTDFFLKEYCEENDSQISHLYQRPESGGPVSTKTPSHSKVRIRLPFSKYARLRNSYRMGTDAHRSRIGRLLEDLDSLAAEISYRHCDGLSEDQYLMIVTASLNRMELKKTIDPTYDLILEGFPVLVGNSSMKIFIRVLTDYGDGEVEQVLQAFFTMVAKDAQTGKTVTINRLELETDEEKELSEIAQNLTRVTRDLPLNEEDFKVLHQFHDCENTLGKDCGIPTSLSETKLENIELMHPRVKNFHGNIFGGFLMRRATELAWVSAAKFFGHKDVDFVALDDNVFLLPVEIGSLVRFNSWCVYSEDDSVQVRVDLTKTSGDELGEEQVSNVFSYTFKNGRGKNELMVLPVDFNEGAKFLEGRKVFKKKEEN